MDLIQCTSLVFHWSSLIDPAVSHNRGTWSSRRLESFRLTSSHLSRPSGTDQCHQGCCKHQTIASSLFLENGLHITLLSFVWVCVERLFVVHDKYQHYSATDSAGLCTTRPQRSTRLPECLLGWQASSDACRFVENCLVQLILFLFLSI